MILLVTDFGLTGPYTGQMKARLATRAPAVPVIDLFADAPAWDPMLSAYLLAAHAPAFPEESVFLCVVDPGVGTGRRPVAVWADQRWYVGPDNGLFELVVRRAREVEAWEITWQPESLSASFHGRDLFAPVAAGLAAGEQTPPGRPAGLTRCPDWPDDLPAITYVDGYGNAMTGLRADRLGEGTRLAAGGRTMKRARTFADVAPGEAMWYENANGLAEIAVNQGRAADIVGIGPGSPVEIMTPDGERGTVA